MNLRHNFVTFPGYFFLIKIVIPQCEVFLKIHIFFTAPVCVAASPCGLKKNASRFERIYQAETLVRAENPRLGNLCQSTGEKSAFVRAHFLELVVLAPV